MNSLNKETQIYAVEKVLEEMKRVEEWACSWNASWSEYLYDAHLLSPISKMTLSNLKTIDGKRVPDYGHEDSFYSTESIGIPLVRKKVIGSDYTTGDINRKYTIEFGRVDWIGMASNNHSREFSFKNNGNIKYSRFDKSEGTNGSSYRTKYNVLDDDFEVFINLGNNGSKSTSIGLLLKDGRIIEKLNNLVVKRDIDGLLLSAVNEADGSSIAEDKISVVETKVIDAIKNIKGEIPLAGLLERISSVLSILEGKKRKVEASKSLKMRQCEIKQD